MLHRHIFSHMYHALHMHEKQTTITSFRLENKAERRRTNPTLCAVVHTHTREELPHEENMNTRDEIVGR